MASDVEIVNSALGLLGHEAITSLLEESDAARTANSIFNNTRDDLISLHPWNFATKWFSVAALSEVPVNPDFTVVYALPTDTIRVLQIEPETAEWVIESGKLYTNVVAPLKLRVLLRVTDNTLFSANFVGVFIYRLRAELSDTLTGKNARSDRYWKDYQLKLQEAKSTDGLEGTPPEEPLSPLISVRLVGGSASGTGTIW